MTERFCKQTGRFCVAFGSVATLVILSILVTNNFVTNEFLGRFFEPLKFLVVIFGFALIGLGIVLIINGKMYEHRLKRLKVEGMAFTPEKTKVICSIPYGHPMSIKENLYAAFHVKCSISTESGKRVVKSPKFVIHQGFLKIIPHPPNMLCEAIIYINPNDPRDIAFEIIVPEFL